MKKKEFIEAIEKCKKEGESTLIFGNIFEVKFSNMLREDRVVVGMRLLTDAVDARRHPIRNVSHYGVDVSNMLDDIDSIVMELEKGVDYLTLELANSGKGILNSILSMKNREILKY